MGKDANEDFDIDFSKDPDQIFGRMGFYRGRNFDGVTPAVFDHPTQSGVKCVRLAVKEGAFDKQPQASDDPNDRCELRELLGNEQTVGAAACYGFTLRAAKPFPKVKGRCVVAQIKMPYGESSEYSPAFSLRIENGQYIATIEHQFLPADRAAGRYLRKLNADGACPPGTVYAEDHARDTPPGKTTYQLRALLADDGAVPPHLLAPGKFDACTDGVTVKRYGLLPKDIHEWSDFIIELAGAGQSAGPSRIALHLNGRLLAEAEGQFGAAGHEGRAQYFKTGPYRDDTDLTRCDMDVWGDLEAAVEVCNIRRKKRLTDAILSRDLLVALNRAGGAGAAGANIG